MHSKTASYKVVEQTKEIESVGKCVTYGICYTGEGAENGENLQIFDISTRRETVERLASFCNEGGASPVHLAEIVSDFLAAGEF